MVKNYNEYLKESVNDIMLYHGTSSVNYDNITNNGLNSPYLTDNIELAEYYAENEVDEKGGDILLLHVYIGDKSKLRYDDNAMSEPVSFGDYDIDDLEDNIQYKYNDAIKSNPDWYDTEHDVINIPDTEWLISLDVVSSVWYDGIIDKTNISIYD